MIAGSLGGINVVEESSFEKLITFWEFSVDVIRRAGCGNLKIWTTPMGTEDARAGEGFTCFCGA